MGLPGHWALAFALDVLDVMLAVRVIPAILCDHMDAGCCYSAGGRMGMYSTTLDYG